MNVCTATNPGWPRLQAPIRKLYLIAGTYTQQDVIDARISPNGSLDVLSRLEVIKLLNASRGELYPLFRSSSLAVLNYGDYLDDGRELPEHYNSYDILVI